VTPDKRKPLKRPERLSKFPKVLQDEVSETRAAVLDAVPLEMLYAYLHIWHQNSARPANGLSPIWIPEEIRLLLDRYVRACTRLARFNRGGAGDYVAEAVLQEVAQEIISREQSRRSSSPRDREGHGDVVTLEDIHTYLKRRNYATASRGEKGGLVSDVIAHFDHKISESKVRRAIAKYFLEPRRRLS
jgi:hypothetical protein